jgi:hypothetical protein
MMNRGSSYVAGVVTGILVAIIVFGGRRDRADAADPQKPKDNADLQRLYNEDQADRTPPAGKSIDWAIVGPRDHAREARVLEMYRTGALKTGHDYHNAAMVLQHANEADRQLLGHELCIVAIAKGELDARWLCAATEDRFLMNIGRPQRFATQYRGESKNGEPLVLKLYKVDQEVTDALRAELKCPPLAVAQQHEREANDIFTGKKP